MASDVICPGCGGRYHETVDEDGFLDGVNGERVPDLRRRRFDPTRPCNGSMLKLKEKYEKLPLVVFSERSVGHRREPRLPPVRRAVHGFAGIRPSSWIPR